MLDSPVYGNDVPSLSQLAGETLTEATDEAYEHEIAFDEDLNRAMNQALIGAVREKNLRFLNSTGNEAFRDMLLRELNIHEQMSADERARAEQRILTLNLRPVGIHSVGNGWRMTMNNSGISLRKAVRAYMNPMGASADSAGMQNVLSALFVYPS